MFRKPKNELSKMLWSSRDSQAVKLWISFLHLIRRISPTYYLFSEIILRFKLLVAGRKIQNLPSRSILDLECRFFNEITRVRVLIKNFSKCRRGGLLDNRNPHDIP
ncbi:MAG TPA: hypothetical protein HA261_11680 [Methanosarcina sp.]|nr:hypothetical protein [Methanosarcina sp.]